MKKLLFLLLTVTAATLAMDFPLAAQPTQRTQRTEPGRQMLTAAERAERQTEIFRRELDLDRKQFKKVRKLYLRKFEKMYPETTGDMPQGPGGMPGNRPGEGSSMERPRGGPSESGRPAHNAPGQQGGRMPAEIRMEPEKDKDIASRRKKMEKILDRGQFGKWSVMERESLESERMMPEGMDGYAGEPDGPGRR